jgi:hypothetical protein
LREQHQPLSEQCGVLGAQPFERVVPLGGDRERGRPRVPRVGIAAHVAEFLEGGDKPGQRGRRDSLYGGQVAEAERSDALDGGQRRELGRGQPGQLVSAQPPGQPGECNAQPCYIDHAAFRAYYARVGGRRDYR